MECFNCNRPAKTELTVDPDFGFMRVCESPACKEKAISDLKRFQKITENNRDRQGRSEEQVEASEKAMAYAIIGLTLALFILTIISFLKK